MKSTNWTGPGYTLIPDYLRPFREALMIQCSSDQVQEAALLANRPGAALVITATRRGSTPLSAALSETYRAGRHLLQTGRFARPFLLDAARYAGASRMTAEAPFDPTWVARQRELGLPVLTDSGYVAEGDDRGLRAILARTTEYDDGIALLPLHRSWLKSPAALDTLVCSVDEAQVPVAIILEYEKDPFGLKGIVPALLRLLRCKIPVMLLRCDVSALGALCTGAFAAAVGTTTSLRHLYPQTDGGGGVDPQIAAIVKECLSYIRVEKIALAAQADPDDVLWQCGCQACYVRSFSQLAIHPKSEQERLAFRHSLEVVLDLRDKLLSNGDSWAVRAESWKESCQNAQCRHLEIESATDKWDPPQFLRYWHEALAPLVLQERVR